MNRPWKTKVRFASWFHSLENCGGWFPHSMWSVSIGALDKFHTHALPKVQYCTVLVWCFHNNQSHRSRWFIRMNRPWKTKVRFASWFIPFARKLWWMVPTQRVVSQFWRARQISHACPPEGILALWMLKSGSFFNYLTEPANGVASDQRKKSIYPQIFQCGNSNAKKHEPENPSFSKLFLSFQDNWVWYHGGTRGSTKWGWW